MKTLGYGMSRSSRVAAIAELHSPTKVCGADWPGPPANGGQLGDLTKLVDFGATLAANRLPFVGRFAETVGYAAEQATAVAQEAQVACQ